jgi:hypothetical protein
VACLQAPFRTELELLQHMRDHHTKLHTHPTQFKLQRPADLRSDCFGMGAVVGGRELQWTSFVD